MREYKFRGYDATGQKGWVYGDLAHNQKVTKTGLEPRTMVGGYEVAPDSVGICTGLKDKNGKDVYEGDKVKVTAFSRVNFKKQRTEYATIVYDTEYASFGFMQNENKAGLIPTTILSDSVICVDIEIIGTSYTPPEQEHNETLDIKLEDCNLSVRSFNICKANGIVTLGDLTKICKVDFLKFRNSGKVSLGELSDLLEVYGLDWKPM